MNLDNLALVDSYRVNRYLRSEKGARCGATALWKNEDVALIQNLETAVRARDTERPRRGDDESPTGSEERVGNKSVKRNGEGAHTRLSGLVL